MSFKELKHQAAVMVSTHITAAIFMCFFFWREYHLNLQDSKALTHDTAPYALHLLNAPILQKRKQAFCKLSFLRCIFGTFDYEIR